MGFGKGRRQDFETWKGVSESSSWCSSLVSAKHDTNAVQF